MDKGKGYDDNNWLRHSSLSQHLMWQERQPNLVLIFSSLFPYVTYLMDLSCFLFLVVYIAQIHSCILTLYQFYHPLLFLKSLPQLQPELKLKVVTVSALCSRCCFLHMFLLFYDFMLYQLTLSYFYLKSLSNLQHELSLKVITFGKALMSSPCKRKIQ